MLSSNMAPMDEDDLYVQKLLLKKMPRVPLKNRLYIDDHFLFDLVPLLLAVIGIIYMFFSV